LVLVVGCSTDYRLSAIEPSSPAPLGADPGAGIPGDQAPVEGPSDEGRPLGIPEIQHQQVLIGGGSHTEVADYLFVVDSSSSMEGILDKVLDGIDALTRDGVFPKDARLGVMNMTPSDPLRPGTIHPSIKSRWWLKFEPGFGDLIDGDRITVFREVAPPYLAERFSAAGCDKWFAPDAKNADGVPCLVANTQISLYPIEVEAGLTSLGQRLERDPPLFRSGAAANVVFVTDTHDPGIPADAPGFADLMSIRPTFAQLETEALSRQQLASFRIHAIAPASVCTAEDWTAAGPAYFEAAKAGEARRSTRAPPRRPSTPTSSVASRPGARSPRAR